MTRRVSRRAVSKLLVDDKACERLAANGRPPVLERHSRAVAKEALVGAVEDALRLEPKRNGATAEDPELFQQRIVYQETQRLRDALCEALRKVVPEGAGLAVATGGATELLRLDPFTAWPYPSPDLDGAGPTDEEDVEAARRDLDGADLQGRRVPGDTSDLGTVARGAAPAASVPRVDIPHRPQPGRAGRYLFA